MVNSQPGSNRPGNWETLREARTAGGDERIQAIASPRTAEAIEKLKEKRC